LEGKSEEESFKLQDVSFGHNALSNRRTERQTDRQTTVLRQ